MTQGADTVHTLVGAYALDALSEFERHQFEAHLGECETCTQEVRGLRETTARLASAVAQRPPLGMRDRVLAEVSQVRQVPPRVAARRPASKRGRTPRLILLAAAACLAVAVGLGVTALRTQQDLDRVQADQRRITEVLSASDARTVSSPVQRGGRGTVIYSPQQNRAVVVMSALPALPDGRTYQLWFMGSGAPRPAGLMSATAPPALLDGVGPATQIGVTVEPDGGSPQPTSDPVFTAKI